MATVLADSVQSLTIPLSGYALYLCYVSITNVRPYEPMTQKAAKWTNVAGDQLKKTRSTLAASTIVSVFSLLNSVYQTAAALPLSQPSAPSSQSTFLTNIRAYSTSTPYQSLLAVGIAAVLLAGRSHLASFWIGKAKVPAATGYNDAITASNILVGVMGVLAAGWIFIGGVKAALAFGVL